MRVFHEPVEEAWHGHWFPDKIGIEPLNCEPLAQA